MEYAICAGVVLALGLLVYLTWEVRQTRKLLEAQAPDWFLTTSEGSALRSGYSIWTYRQGRWNLEKEYCESGYEPGAPPENNGAYEGQCVRKECVRPAAR